MEKRIIKRIGCIVALLIFLGFPAFLIGELYYDVVLKRTYIKLDGYKTITIWKNCIIFNQYWYPFYPKENYIHIKSTWDYYDVSFTVTKDSVLGIWSNDSIEVFGLDEFKAIEMYERDDKHEEWANRYSFSCVSEFRKDSLQLELGYEMWFPHAVQIATYRCRSDNGMIREYYGNIGNRTTSKLLNKCR